MHVERKYGEKIFKSGDAPGQEAQGPGERAGVQHGAKGKILFINF